MQWRINPRVHLVRETEAARYLRRELRDDDLVTYFDTEQGKWCVGYWTDKSTGMLGSSGYLAKLEIGRSLVFPPQLTREIVSTMRRYRGPVDYKQQAANVRERARAQDRREIDSSMDETERYRWAQKRLQTPIPYAIT